MRHRLTRTVAAVALLGAPLTLAGAALVASSVPASADTAGTNVCSTAVSTTDFSTGLSVGTLSGCHQQGSGTFENPIDPQNPTAPVLGTIHWATGHATTHLIATPAFDPSVPCPAGDFGESVQITAVDGAYAGSTGGQKACADPSDFPIFHATNVGPVVI